MKSFETFGIWWLPENPGRRLPGTLIFDKDDDLLLKIFGGLFEEKDDGIREPPIILGETQSGKNFTLYYNVCVKAVNPNPGFFEETYKSNFAFEGAHVSLEFLMRVDTKIS